jgi:hypothetical protein
MLKNKKVEKFMKARKYESLIDFMLRINSGITQKKEKRTKNAN